jgi:hypothetical protein
MRVCGYAWSETDRGRECYVVNGQSTERRTRRGHAVKHSGHVMLVVCAALARPHRGVDEFAVAVQRSHQQTAAPSAAATTPVSAPPSPFP